MLNEMYIRQLKTFCFFFLLQDGLPVMLFELIGIIFCTCKTSSVGIIVCDRMCIYDSDVQKMYLVITVFM